MLKESESHKVIRKIEAFKDKDVIERILKEEEDRELMNTYGFKDDIE